MKLRLFILLIVFAGCVQKVVQPPTWLQRSEVRMAIPMLSASSRLIDSVVTINAELYYPGVEIYYTDNGSIPDKSSNRYNGPLKVETEGTYTFRAFHPQLLPSDISRISLSKKGLAVEKFELESGINNKYPGQGALTLVNNEKGSPRFTDGQWMGSEEDVIVRIKLQEGVKPENINVGYLCDTGSWIFPPAKVIAYTSQDGENFIEDNSVQLANAGGRSDLEIRSVKLSLAHPARFIKLKIENLKSIPEWHEGAGTKAWLFLDEIIVN